MNSRERFEAVCRYQEPDRFPIDYLADPAVDELLKKFYGIETERALLDKLGCDFYYLSCRDISQNESSLAFYKGPKLEMTDGERVCPFGIRFKRGAYASKFAVDESIAGPLLSATSEKDILNHNWPKVEWFDFEPLLAECEKNKDRVIVGGMWTGIMGDSFRLFGLENFLLNMAANPKVIKTLINRMCDFYLEINEHIFSLLKGKLDVWFFGNDFGGQKGLLFSSEMFCDFFLDNIKTLTNLAHSFGLKVMKHSCGAIKPIIPLLIDAGIDILDPIQVTADGMAPADLQADFGGKIVFHGGIDTQQVLPNSTPEQVSQHCVEIMRALGKDNGYIFAPSQLLKADIAVENIDAMYKTAKQYKPA